MSRTHGQSPILIAENLPRYASQTDNELNLPPNTIQFEGDSILTNDPEFIDRVLGHKYMIQAGFQAESFAAKLIQLSKYLSNLNGSDVKYPVTWASGDEHTEVKRMLYESLSYTKIKSYIGILEDTIDQKIVMLSNLQPGSKVDLIELSGTFAIAVICKVIGLDGDTEQMRKDLNELFLEESPLISLQKISRFYSDHIDPSIKSRKAKISQKESGQSSNGDLLMKWVEDGYNWFNIMFEVIQLLGAGFTTLEQATTLLFLHCISEPLNYNIMTEDKDGIESELKKRGESEEKIEDIINNLDKAKNDIIYGVLRHEPVFSKLFRRASEDVSIKMSYGRIINIPKGTKIVIDVVGAHKNHIYGKQDELLIGLNAAIAQGFVFGALKGVHHCPGEKLALEEIKILLRNLLPFFKDSSINPKDIIAMHHDQFQGNIITRATIAKGWASEIESNNKYTNEQ